MRILTCFILACGLAHSGTAAAQDDYTRIENRLDAGQMKATGLDRLSAEQLELLNTLLSEDRKSVVKATRDESAKRESGSRQDQRREPIDTRLKGEFRGWSAGSRFELENGQQWTVTEGEYRTRKPVASPRIVITPGRISGWYMQVEGQNPQAKVRRAD